MSESSTAVQARNWIQPTWRHGLFAAVLAGAAFFLPQEIPFEWYPLNDPGNDINYLEISCAADVGGDVQIAYDVARAGHRPIDTIRWPVSPSTNTFTYTFPLPDAPITEMRVGLPKDGVLTIRQMRIINRRGKEIRRFTRDLFRPMAGIAAISPLPDGWKLVAQPGASDPLARLELFAKIVPVDMNQRNLQRCLLSTGYLSLMLAILLLAILFVFHRPKGWRDALGPLGFIAAMALCFAVVGNRGLIRSSFFFARYVPPVAEPGLKLEIDLAGSSRFPAQLFWDFGQGFAEATSVRANYEPHSDLQTLRFLLPPGPISGLRFDPADSPGTWTIRGMRIVDQGQRTRAVLPLSALTPVRELNRFELVDQRLQLATPTAASDPIVGFSAEGLAAINAVLAAPAEP